MLIGQWLLVNMYESIFDKIKQFFELWTTDAVEWCNAYGWAKMVCLQHFLTFKIEYLIRSKISLCFWWDQTIVLKLNKSVIILAQKSQIFHIRKDSKF